MELERKRRIYRKCRYCDITKMLEEFTKGANCRYGYAWLCIVCKNKANRARYKKQGYTPRKKTNRRILNRLKTKSGCKKCGYDKFACALHFHHIEPKSFEISKQMHRPLRELIEEIRKCIILCANCHSVEHLNKKEKFYLTKGEN